MAEVLGSNPRSPIPEAPADPETSSLTRVLARLSAFDTRAAAGGCGHEFNVEGVGGTRKRGGTTAPPLLLHFNRPTYCGSPPPRLGDESYEQGVALGRRRACVVGLLLDLPNATRAGGALNGLLDRVDACERPRPSRRHANGEPTRWRARTQRHRLPREAPRNPASSGSTTTETSRSASRHRERTIAALLRETPGVRRDHDATCAPLFGHHRLDVRRTRTPSPRGRGFRRRCKAARCPPCPRPPSDHPRVALHATHDLAGVLPVNSTSSPRRVAMVESCPCIQRLVVESGVARRRVRRLGLGDRHRHLDLFQARSAKSRRGVTDHLARRDRSPRRGPTISFMTRSPSTWMRSMDFRSGRRRLREAPSQCSPSDNRRSRGERLASRFCT